MQYLDRLKGRSDEEKIQRKISRAIKDGYMTIRDLSIKHGNPYSTVAIELDIAEQKKEISRRIRQEWYVNEEQFLQFHECFTKGIIKQYENEF